MKIRKLKLRDYFTNLYLKYRYQFIRHFRPKRLINKSPIHKENHKLIFCDNFDKENWDYNGYDKWRIGETWGLYHPDKPNVYYGPPTVKKDDGVTAFTVKYKPKKFLSLRNDDKINIPFEVSLLSSEKMFRSKYGRFECRMTLPKEPGTWPAFWLYGNPWPPEVDIIETYGGGSGQRNRIQEINIHYGANPKIKNIGAWKIKIDKAKNLGKNFYEFAFDWTPQRMDFYTNGIRVFQFTDDEILNEWFNTDMFIIINNSLQSSFMPDEDYYSEFLVDYIRVYKQNNNEI